MKYTIEPIFEASEGRQITRVYREYSQLSPHSKRSHTPDVLKVEFSDGSAVEVLAFGGEDSWGEEWAEIELAPLHPGWKDQYAECPHDALLKSLHDAA